MSVCVQLGKADFPSLSSHLLPVVPVQACDPEGFFSFHSSKSIFIVIVQILFMKSSQ